MSNKIAIGVFSGGLDSWVSALLIKEQGFDVKLLHFVTPFFGLQGLNLENLSKQAGDYSMELIVHYFGLDYINVLKDPKYGRGKGINPCIDCHLHMIKTAKKYMDNYKAKFVFTGEVLGQRPMSQTKNSLKIIENRSGLKGYLLRPLSAKILDITVAETNQDLDRNKLLDISGRSRKIQEQIAKRFKLNDYPHPAGGCKLTHNTLRSKFNNIISNYKTADWDLINLVNIGRHYNVSLANELSVSFVVSRDEKEHRYLDMYGYLGIKIYLKDYISSIGLLLANNELLNHDSFETLTANVETNKSLKIWAKILKRYSKANDLDLENINIILKSKNLKINKIINVDLSDSEIVDIQSLKLE